MNGHQGRSHEAEPVQARAPRSRREAPKKSKAGLAAMVAGGVIAVVAVVPLLIPKSRLLSFPSDCKILNSRWHRRLRSKFFY